MYYKLSHDKNRVSDKIPKKIQDSALSGLVSSFQRGFDPAFSTQHSRQLPTCTESTTVQHHDSRDLRAVYFMQIWITRVFP